jgi:hypothetical protein
MPGHAALSTTLLILLLGGVYACGEEENASPASEGTQSPSSTVDLPDWPGCDEVWTADAKLPLNYKGCLEEDQAVRAEKHPCAFGLPIVTYDDRFYAVAGRTINEVESLRSDQRFKNTLTVCAG